MRWWTVKVVCGALLISSLFLMVLYSITPLFRFTTSVAQMLVMLGAGISLWHYRLLKQSNRTLSKPQQLMNTRGLYRWIRHPMYAADMIMYLGLALLAPNWLTVAILPVAFLALVRQAQMEDAYLAQRFGRPYDHWRNQSWMIMPLVY